MKEMLRKLRELEQIATAADEAYEADPENEELENAFDEAYNNEWNAREELIKELVKFTAGAIDEKTARLMLSTKRDDLESIINRLA